MVSDESHKQGVKWFQVLLQLGKEFGLPLVIAAVWCFLESREQVDYNYLDKGSLHFFALSFFSAQWNRVTKQMRTEKGLSSVEGGIRQLLSDLKTTAKNIAGYATGGDSFCWVEPTQLYLLTREFIVHHEGVYPIRDLQVRVVDLSRMNGGVRPSDAMFENVYMLDLLIPGHVRQIKLNSPVGLKGVQNESYNIFVSCPNGSYIQLLRTTYVDGKLSTAVRVEKDGATIFEKIDDGFPLGTNGQPDWDTHNQPIRVVPAQ